MQAAGDCGGGLDFAPRGVTAGQGRHNSNNVGGVTAGQVRHNSSNNNNNKIPLLSVFNIMNGKLSSLLQVLLTTSRWTTIGHIDK